MGYIQTCVCLVVVMATVSADYQGPSDYRRPTTSYGTPAASYGGGPYRGSSGEGWKDERPKSYQFGYAVRDYASGNDFGRHETSDGDTVHGQYRVQLPDGRTQIVTYTADWQNGFQADVKYEGEAFYPDKPNNNYQNNNNYNNNNYQNNNNYNNNNYNNQHGYQGSSSFGGSGYRKGGSFGQGSYNSHSKGHGSYRK